MLRWPLCLDETAALDLTLFVYSRLHVILKNSVLQNICCERPITGSGRVSGCKCNRSGRVGSGSVKRFRVWAGLGLQFKARADLYFKPIYAEKLLSQ